MKNELLLFSLGSPYWTGDESGIIEVLLTDKSEEIKIIA
jgi:hypothetical protein